jgi:hypothetical protein
MSHNVQNKYAFGSVVYARDQAIVVAVNVEHRSAANGVGVSEIAFQVHQ